MLNLEESKFIQEHIYCSDQDYFFWSRLLGEPFLYDGILYYFDGKTLSIIGFPFEARLTEEYTVNQRVNEGISVWLEKEEFIFINYVGPWDIELNPMLSKIFCRYYTQEPRKYNVDVFLDLQNPKTLKTRNARDSIKKANKQGYSVRICQRDFLTFQHLNLLRLLISRQPIVVEDISTIVSSISFLNAYTTLFELEIQGTLAGFAITHEYFYEKPFLITACFDHNAKCSSDAIYYSIINYYIKKGASFLGLGYSGDQGLYNYKTKWGKKWCNQPIYQLAWKKRGTRERAEAYCLHWSTSLIINNL